MVRSLQQTAEREDDVDGVEDFDEAYVPDYLTCSHGSCSHDPEVVYWSEGKAFYLCDEHWEKLVSTDLKTEKATRAKLGIPMPVFRQDQCLPKWERASVVVPILPAKKAFACAMPGCKETPEVTVRHTQLCEKHWKATRSSDVKRRWDAREALGWTEEDLAKANAETEKLRKKLGPVKATREKEPVRETKSSQRRKAIMEEPVADKPRTELDEKFDDFAAMIAGL